MATSGDEFRVGRVLSSAWTIWVRLLPRLLAPTAICRPEAQHGPDAGDLAQTFA